MPTQTAKMSKSKKAGLKFSVDKCRKRLRQGRYAKKIQVGAAVYMAGVLEYLLTEMLEISGDAARDNRKARITPRHVKLAVKNDTEYDQLVGDAVFTESGVAPFIHKVLLAQPSKGKKKTSRASTGTTSTSASGGRSGSGNSSRSKNRSGLTVEISRRASPSRVMHGESYYEEDHSFAV